MTGTHDEKFATAEEIAASMLWASSELERMLREVPRYSNGDSSLECRGALFEIAEGAIYHFIHRRHKYFINKKEVWSDKFVAYLAAQHRGQEGLVLP
jgi:hypothetical protein